MKKILIPILGLLALTSCESSPELKSSTLNFIEGKLENYDGHMVFLERLDAQNVVLVDTVTVDEEGNFICAPEIQEEGYYRLIVEETNFARLILEPGDSVVVNADVLALEPSYKVSGSKESERLAWLSQFLLRYAATMDSIEQISRNAQITGDMQVLQSLYFTQMNLNGEAGKKMGNFIQEAPGALSSLVAAQRFNPADDFAMYSLVEDAMKKERPHSPYLASLSRTLDKVRKTQVGSIPPNIVGSNPKGEQISLEDQRGKIILLDFWASWCKPCRAENPNVVEAYKKYKDKGFEIFSVSLDERKDAWLKAIAADEMTWLHVSDLGGWRSSAAALYSISSIPATFLLDKEGRIIDKNLRGEALHIRLEELLRDV